MADAHNLAWKIGAVLAGWDSPGLLSSYAAERKPVAWDTCAADRSMWDDVAAGRVTPARDLRILDMGYIYASEAILAAPASPTDTVELVKPHAAGSRTEPSAQASVLAPAPSGSHEQVEPVSAPDVVADVFASLDDPLAELAPPRLQAISELLRRGGSYDRIATETRLFKDRVAQLAREARARKL